MGAAFSYFWYFAVPLVRVAGAIFLIVRRRASQPSLPSWRMALFLAGVLAVLVLAMPSILQMSLSFLPARAVDRLAGMMFVFPLVEGLVLFFVAAVLVSFGKGRARWLGWLILLPSLPQLLGLF